MECPSVFQFMKYVSLQKLFSVNVLGEGRSTQLVPVAGHFSAL